MPSVPWTTTLATCFALLCGCGDAGPTGSYRDAAGGTRYEFQRHGQVRITVLDTTVAGEYTLQGDKVIVTSPQGTVVLTRRGTSLYGPMGLELSPVGLAPAPPDHQPERNHDDHGGRP